VIFLFRQMIRISTFIFQVTHLADSIQFAAMVRSYLKAAHAVQKATLHSRHGVVVGEPRGVNLVPGTCKQLIGHLVTDTPTRSGTCLSGSQSLQFWCC
jgi:hypothetical protein